MKQLRIGTRAQVYECSGLSSRRIGTVIKRDLIPVDHRGIPKIIGHYKPMLHDEVALIDDQGQFFTMFRNRLIVL